MKNRCIVLLLIVSLFALPTIGAFPATGAERSKGGSASKIEKPKSVGSSSKTKKSTRKKSKPTASKESKESSSRRERAIEAKYEKAMQLVKKLRSSQRTKLLRFINRSEAEELRSVKGIGKAKAARLIKERPFEQPAEVVRLPRFGIRQFEDLIAYSKAN